jgi:hypothetical protein
MLFMCILLLRQGGVLGYFHYLATIEYFRLNIEYLRSASGGSILKGQSDTPRTRRASADPAGAPAQRERHPQIFPPEADNLQFSVLRGSGLGIATREHWGGYLVENYVEYFTKDQEHQIHATTLRVLEEVGVRFQINWD